MGFPVDKKLVFGSVLGLFILVFILASLSYSYRIPFTTYLWSEYRLMPAVAVYLSKDAALAKEIGNHYFNEDREGVYDIDRAERYFFRALELDPRVPGAWYQLGRISFLRGEFYQAVERFNRQLEVHGEAMPNVYYMRGLTYGFDGQLEKAEEDFLRYLEFKAASWAANNDLAWVYYEQGNFEKMKARALEALRYSPSNPWVLTMLGTAELNLENKASARDAFTKALEGAHKLAEDDWITAYPGNDPRVAEQGIDEMIRVIEHNLSLTVD